MASMISIDTSRISPIPSRPLRLLRLFEPKEPYVAVAVRFCTTPDKSACRGGPTISDRRVHCSPLSQRPRHCGQAHRETPLYSAPPSALRQRDTAQYLRRRRPAADAASTPHKHALPAADSRRAPRRSIAHSGEPDSRQRYRPVILNDQLDIALISLSAERSIRRRLFPAPTAARCRFRARCCGRL